MSRACNVGIYLILVAMIMNDFCANYNNRTSSRLAISDTEVQVSALRSVKAR